MCTGGKGGGGGSSQRARPEWWCNGFLHVTTPFPGLSHCAKPTLPETKMVDRKRQRQRTSPCDVTRRAGEPKGRDLRRRGDAKVFSLGPEETCHRRLSDVQCLQGFTWVRTIPHGSLNTPSPYLLPHGALHGALRRTANAYAPWTVKYKNNMVQTPVTSRKAEKTRPCGETQVRPEPGLTPKTQAVALSPIRNS